MEITIQVYNYITDCLKVFKKDSLTDKEKINYLYDSRHYVIFDKMQNAKNEFELQLWGYVADNINTLLCKLGEKALEDYAFYRDLHIKNKERDKTK